MEVVVVGWLIGYLVGWLAGERPSNVLVYLRGVSGQINVRAATLG